MLTIDKDTCNSVENFGIKSYLLSKSYTIFLTRHVKVTPSNGLHDPRPGDLRSHQHNWQDIDTYKNRKAFVLKIRISYQKDLPFLLEV